MNSIFIFSLLFSSYTLQALQIPHGLSMAEEFAITEILGVGTSSKHLTNPYPLGGYSGFEVATAIETIDISDLNQYGTGASNADRLHLTTISIGKGLFNNFDLFLNFTPLTDASGVVSYSGIVKWGFFQADFIPINIAVITHFTNFSADNLFSSSSLGLDFVGGINFNSVSFYSGIGFIDSLGTFAGGPSGQGANPTLYQERVRLKRTHGILGTTIHLEPFFVALQVDRYQDIVFSGKLGFRF